MIKESIHVFDESTSNDDRLIEGEDQGDWINIDTQSSPKEASKQ